MKNKIYYLGLFSCLFVTVGCLFKIMHWPGAGIQMTIGILFLSFIFLPVSLIDNYKKNSDKSAKWLYILTGIILAINFVSALFKIMHWPGAGMLFLIAMPLPFIVLLPAFLIYYKNDKEINYGNFMAIIFFFAYFAAISALLTIKPNRLIIDSYEEQAMSISKNSKIFQNYIASNDIKEEEIIKKAQIVTREISKIKSLISNEEAKRIDYKLIPESDKGFHIKNMENNVFVEPDELKLLRNTLIDYKNALKSYSQKDDLILKKLDILLDTDDSEDLEWDKKWVNGKIVIAALNELSMLEYQVEFTKEVVLNK